MGKYDDILAGLPPVQAQPSGGSKYDDLVGDLPTEQKMGGEIPLSLAMEKIGSLSPASRIRQGFKDIAGYGAEKMGGAGVNPNLSAALMTPVAMAPELLAAGTAIGDIVAGDRAISQAIRKTPKMLGKEFQTGEKAAGITGELPVQRGFDAKVATEIHGNPPSVSELPYKPKSYPKDVPSFLNFVKARVQGLGDKLSPQELDDYKTMLSTNLDAMKAKGLSSTEPFAIASQLRKQVTELHNAAIPGREELNKVFAISKTIHPDMAGWIKDGVNKYGAKAIGAVLAGLGFGAGTQLFK